MMTMQQRLAALVQSFLLAAVALTGVAHAQDVDVDPPGRVARLSEASGQVWLYSPDGTEWVAASRNRPLTTGDRLATEAGARAELQIGSTTVRIDASSEIEVVRLDDEHVVLDLHDGSAIAQVRDLAGAGQLEVTTDEGRFVTLRTGSYRFDRNNGKSDVTVYAGEARYEGPNSGLPVNAGQRAEFWIDSGGVAQYSTLTPVNDAFAGWSNGRDRRIVSSISERYVSPEMTGGAELDNYGRWEQTPDYGSVWIPTAVAADWAPYSQGHWAFVRPWGWTWVDDAPWGFAPFHYGRWVYVRNNWCWTPGTRVARPVYAPALVAWVGGPRGNLSVTVGGGPVGWFPLAPREVYVPSYRVSPRYARNVNITNVTNVTVINNAFANPQGPRDFENRRFPRAITVVPSNVFTERQPVAPAAAQFRQAPWVRDYANDRARAPAMLAPQIAIPPMPARNADPRAVRLPPGARPDARDRAPGVGDRPAAPRDRNEADRGRDGRPQPWREPDRGAVAPVQRPPGLPAQPAVESARPVEPNRAATGSARPAPGVQQPITPTTNPAAVTPPPAPLPERPTMRAQPVQRGDERGDGRRGDEQRTDDRRQQRPASPPAQVQVPTPVQPPQLQPSRVERPVPSMARPTEAQRPPETQRPTELQRPAAAPVAPAAQQLQQRSQAPQQPPQAQPRAEPRQEAQQPRPQRPEPRGDEPKRGDPREPREPR